MRVSILLSFLVVLSGCSQTRPTALATPDGRAEMNARTSGRTATLGLRGAPTRAVRGLHVGPDETTWTDRLSGRPQSAPTADVTSVSMRRGTIWKPVLIGAAAGTALGLLTSGQSAQSDAFLAPQLFSPAVLVATATIAGTAVGAGIGAVRTTRYRPTEARLGAPADSPAVP